MKLKIFKQVALLLVAGVVGMGIGVAIMWNSHKASAAGESGHEHALTIHLGEAATCEADGLRDYWECPQCHEYFADAEGFTEIAADELESWQVIPHLEHHTHFYAYKNATCAEEGNNPYYACYGCGKVFLDETCKVETTMEAVTIAKKAHPSIKHVDAKAANCQADGCYEHYECVSCYQTFADAEGTIPFPGAIIKGTHHTHYEEFQDATCEEEGHKAYYECEDCGKIFTDAEYKNEVTAADLVIEAKGHWSEPVEGYHFAAKDKTCVEDGNPEYWMCIHDGCGKYFTDRTCKNEFDISILEDESYKAVGHHDYSYYVYDAEYLVNQDTVRLVNDAGNLVAGSDKVEYYSVCTICHEHQASGSAEITYKVRGFAEKFNNDADWTYEINEDKEVVADVITFNVSAMTGDAENGYDFTIKISVAANYSEDSTYQFNGADATGMNGLVYKKSGKSVMDLNIHLDTLPEEDITADDTTWVWAFDWDGDGTAEQTIKVAINA